MVHNLLTWHTHFLFLLSKFFLSVLSVTIMSGAPIGDGLGKMWKSEPYIKGSERLRGFWDKHTVTSHSKGPKYPGALKTEGEKWCEHLSAHFLIPVPTGGKDGRSMCFPVWTLTILSPLPLHVFFSSLFLLLCKKWKKTNILQAFSNTMRHITSYNFKKHSKLLMTNLAQSYQENWRKFHTSFLQM